MKLPCLKPVEGGRRCQKYSTHFAVDNRAVYAHLCESCWKALDEAERELYVLGGEDR